MVKNFMEKDMRNFLDSLASDIYVSNTIKVVILN